MTVSRIDSSMRIRLFTSVYVESNPARSGELDESLRTNLGNAAFDEVCLFLEGENAPAPATSERIRTRRLATRPTYADYFTWISDVASPDDVSILANSDIFFDSQMGLFRIWAPGADEALCLSRWETGTETYVNDRNDSQDIWIFKGKVKAVEADFPVGVPRCDNRVAHQLEAAGYRVYNPAFSLRAFHLHSGPRHEYSTDHQADFVPPPYKYIWPHNLWSLSKTLAHNARYPAWRVFWRLDRRKVSRTLKLHWFTRLYATARHPLAR